MVKHKKILTTPTTLMLNKYIPKANNNGNAFVS